MFLGKIFIYSFESNKRAHVLALLHSWQTDHNYLFGLNHINTNKLIIQGQLIYWTTRFAITLLIVSTNAIVIYFSVEAYLYHNYSIAILIVQTLAIIIWLQNSINFLYIFFFCLVMPITMIKYKFDEIFNTLRINMQWNNSRQIIQSIKQHQRTTKLLNELGQLYSRIMFVIYLVLPYTLGDLIKLSIAPNMNQYIRMTAIAILVVILILILVYFFNYICASITVRNKNAPKYLYSRQRE